jgi:SH3-like domain-containing protein
MRRGILAALVAAAALSSLNAAATPAGELDPNGAAPRFVSLKADGANGRHGPSIHSRVDWIYQRAELPLEIVAANGPWRRVRDPDGAETWMYAQNLDARRTAYFRQAAPLLRQPHHSSATAAYVAQGVVGGLTACQGDWRRVAVSSHVGWVDKSVLWGADDCAGV